MFNTIIWGTGTIFNNSINTIKYHECINLIKVLGVTSNTDIFNEFYGFKFIKKENIKSQMLDLLIVMADGKIYTDIVNEAVQLGLNEKKIVSYKILNHPNLDIDKYLSLINNPVSIFANNCWGGFTYNHLNLQFSSPLINMWETDKDYLKLLLNPKMYMSYELKLEKMIMEPVLKRPYPLCSLGDILLHFNHFESYDEAYQCWERRKSRINWENIFAMMWTENRETAELFSKLPYKNKICFVPFKTDNTSLCYVDFYKNELLKDFLFKKVVNYMAKGFFPYYDDITLLVDGKIKKINKVK